MIVGKIFSSLLLLLAVVYHTAFFIMPSITIVNHSDHDITHAEIILPNSKLDFGAILSQQENTLHYSLKQIDGQYQYQINLKNGAILQGSCGYVTNNEIHKRVTVHIEPNGDVVCQP